MPIYTPQKMSPDQFLRIGTQSVHIRNIVNIVINDSVNVGSSFIHIFMIDDMSVSFFGEDAKKYITSLGAWMRIYGEITLIEYAEKIRDSAERNED